MRLFIAEKPSLGRAIAEGLGGGKPGKGHIVCGQDTVTWCFGHLLENFNPEDYDPSLRSWDKETLPIIPPVWRLKPRKDALEQLGVIKKLLIDAALVVNAGDPDREGQLLVDEVLERCAFKGPVKRIWLASLDDNSVKKALANLTDNTRHAPLRDSARARSRADWLVGINATRAMTLLGRVSGLEGVLSLGRVQTPTLNLVVTRDREIAAFRAVEYLVLQASLAHPAGLFTATFAPSDMQAGLDAQGRLIDQAVAGALVSSVKGGEGTVAAVIREKKQTAPPLPHCLSSLQKAASSKLGMTAQEVLDTAQKLYENKLTTYPRSDCRYLPVEQFDDAPRILVALNKLPELENAAFKADTSLRGPVWNTQNVTAHHAIIPTGECAGNLAGKERALYLMIAMAYCLQFYPPLRYEAQKITVDMQTPLQTRWEARGRLVLDAGWTSCTQDEDDSGKADQALPAVAQGDVVICEDVTTLKKKTTPPPRFTEGTLIEAMAGIHRFVTDAAAKATLKENEGLGTEATRAGILEGLKKRGYLVASGKSLVSTPLGGKIIDLTPPALTDPVTTAQWESRLNAIAQGTLALETFMAEQIRVLPGLLEPLLTATPTLDTTAHACPTCGKAMQRRKGGQGFFWGCSGYPECRTTLPDAGGKPGQREAQKAFPCPDCGGPLKHFKNKKGDMCFGCFAEGNHADGKPHFWDDKGGKPHRGKR